MILGTSSAGRCDIYEPVKVLWYGYMEEVVCNGDDLVLNPLFNSLDASYPTSYIESDCNCSGETLRH